MKRYSSALNVAFVIGVFGLFGAFIAGLYFYWDDMPVSIRAPLTFVAVSITILYALRDGRTERNHELL